MKKEDTDLIGEAIDFYNLNHFKGKETKKRLVKLKKELQALIIPVVSTRKLPPWVRPLIAIVTMSLVTLYTIYKVFYV